MNLPVSEIVSAELQAEKFFPIFDPVEIFYPFTPIVDGVDLIQNPLFAFMEGNININVSIMSGTVANESLMFIWQAFPTPLPVAEFKLVLEGLFPGKVKEILQQYPIPPGTQDSRDIMSVMGTDFLFTCPQRAAMRGQVQVSTQDSYLYYYNHTASFYEAWGPNYTECWTGVVCHASELPFVFHSAQDGNYSYTPEELILTEQMGMIWTNFAATGDPNSPNTVPYNGVNWPPYVTSSSISLQFNTPSFTEGFIFSDKCDFWDQLGYFNDAQYDRLFKLFLESL
jgi:carboxylesterase type B